MRHRFSSAPLPSTDHWPDQLLFPLQTPHVITPPAPPGSGTTRRNLGHLPHSRLTSCQLSTTLSVLIHKPHVGKLLYLLQLHFPPALIRGEEGASRATSCQLSTEAPGPQLSAREA